jgi:hypothetical protein
MARSGETLALASLTDDAASRFDSVLKRQTFDTLIEWTRAFLMSEHAALGRKGAVCPYTPTAARIDGLRFGASLATTEEPERIRREMRAAFTAFDAIRHPAGMGAYRAVVIGYPVVSDVSVLKRAQKSLRLESLLRRRMIAVFHPNAPERGLWNKDFRPLRAPIPIFAVRALVPADAAFALRHPLLALMLLIRFPVDGSKQITRAMRRG